MRRRPDWSVAILAAVAAAVAAVSIWLATALVDPAAASEPQPETLPETVAVSGSSQDGAGRLVFDWPAPVAYSARLEGDSVILAFSRPTALDLGPALADLGGYVREAEVAEDGRHVTLHLAGGYDLAHFTDGFRIVLDLIGPKPDTITPEALAPAAGPEEDPVRVRVGEHPGFSRIVFDWTTDVAYALTREGDTAVLRFRQPRALDLRRVFANRPSRLRAIETTQEEGAVALRLAIAPEARLRNFREGTKIVLDILDPAKDAAASKPKATEAVMKPEVTETAPEPKPAETAAASPSVAPESPALPAPAAPIPLVNAAPADSAPESGTEIVPVRVTADADGIVLDFAWPTPVAAAAFRRAGSFWLVFDRPVQFDLREVKAANHLFLGRVAQQASGSAAVLLFTTDADAAPRLSRDGAHWIADFRPQVQGPDSPIAQRIERQAAEGVRLLLPVRGAGEAVALEDPEVGDRIVVVPVAEAGVGVAEGRDWPEFRLLPTLQGIAVVPRADDLVVRSVAEGVSIGSVGGLLVSDVATRHAAAEQGPPEQESSEHAPPEPSATPSPELPLEPLSQEPFQAASQEPIHGPRLLDLPAWRRNGPATFTLARQALQQAVVEVPAARQETARLDLARFFFAHGLAAEAAGVLELIRQESPGRMRDPEILLLSGASAVLMEDYREAQQFLAHKSLDGEPEATLWHAALAGSLEEWSAAAQAFEETAGLIADYPEAVRFRLRLLAAEAMIEAGDPVGALEPLDAMRADSPDAEQTAQIAFLDGRRAATEGRPVEARAIWQDLADDPHQPSRARALLALTEMALEGGEITPAEAIDRLERVRFMWRGGPFEFTVLRRLGQLYLAEGAARNGLSILRQAASNFPDDPRAGAVAQEMAEAFRQLYLENGADRLSPLSAVALFEEFRELTPTGAEGDAMIAALADRLVAVDLLGRAAALLDEQVQFRLSGLEKARTGTRLAAIRLLDRQSDAALTALAASAVEEMPEALVQKRRRLEAQALFELGRGAEALAKLEGDDSHDAALLRADMLWRLREWAEAADAFAQLLAHNEDAAEDETAPAGKHDPSVSQLVLNQAVALSLSGDRERLAMLADRYGAMMESDPLGESFRLLTAETGAADATRPIAERLAGVGALESFMAAYRDRLQTASLSGQE